MVSFEALEGGNGVGEEGGCVGGSDVGGLEVDRVEGADYAVVDEGHFRGCVSEVVF